MVELHTNMPLNFADYRVRVAQLARVNDGRNDTSRVIQADQTLLAVSDAASTRLRARVQRLKRSLSVYAAMSVSFERAFPDEDVEFDCLESLTLGSSATVRRRVSRWHASVAHNLLRRLSNAIL